MEDPQLEDSTYTACGRRGQRYLHRFLPCL